MSDRYAPDRLPLSPMQRGMLFHHLSGGAEDVDLQQVVVRLEEDVDAEAMRGAWRRLVRRHPALRSHVEWDDERAARRVVSESLEPPLEVVDLTALPDADREAALERVIREARKAGFDPGRAPLFRIHLVRFGPGDLRLLLSFHHLVMDGRSTAIVLDELERILDAIRAGKEPDLPTPPAYARFLEWLGARDASGDDAYWSSVLADVEEPTPVPGSRGSGAGPAPPGDAPEEHESRLSAEETRALQAFADEAGVTLNALVQAALASVLAAFAGEDDVVYGVTRAVRPSGIQDIERMVGVLIQTHPVRVRIDGDASVRAWLRSLKEAHSAMGPHALADLARVQGASGVPPGTPLFDVLYMYDHREMTSSLGAGGRSSDGPVVRIIERPPYAMTVYAYGEPELLLRIATDPGRVEEGSGPRLLEHLRHALLELAADPDRPLAAARGLPPSETEGLSRLSSGPALDLEPEPLVHERILALAESAGERSALVAGERSVGFAELARAARGCAEALRRRGIGPGSLVGIHGDRSIETVVALLGTLEAGAAYVPLDPSYPEARLRFMVEDSGASLVVEGPGASVAWGPGVEAVSASDLLRSSEEAGVETRLPAARPASDDLAYVIYTSGSTGRPKGVMVEHRQLRNFAAAMDEPLGREEPGSWLSVTSLSFDISVLELLWTLSRGWRVVLPEPAGASGFGAPVEAGPAGAAPHGSGRPGPRDRTSGGRGGPDVGLFYFAAASGEGAEEGYRLLLEGARRAERHGFRSVWTPERHFHPFGGLYPNPSVAGAALAAITRTVQIRAGSVVLPLHDPVRVAEEWSVVDNLSGGRVGVAFASGWQRDDFVLAPDRYEERHEAMYRGIDIVQRLWRGEEVFLPGVGGDPVPVRLFPRPVQSALPMWLTAAGSPETFRRAGEIGAGVLTHLLGQTPDDLAASLAIYREARREAGRDPEGGHVAVMLHTFVGQDDDEVRDLVRAPLRAYLRSSVSLIKNYSGVWASRTRSGGAEAEGDEFERLSEADLEALLDRAFDRYYETSGLLGPLDKCAELAGRLEEVGVDELACLIDFGVEADRALDALDDLAALRDALGRGGARGGGAVRAVPRAGEGSPADGAVSGVAETVSGVPEAIRRHGVTHMQCTPSLARMLLADPEGCAALGELETLLIGGEAFPGTLARGLREVTDARILNMYGPTETTVWSSVATVRGDETGVVPIGRPIANTTLHVLDGRGRRMPAGAAGELCIAGDGVARGYLHRPELTAERFRPDPFAGSGDGRLYRTGDRVRWDDEGRLRFLGRVDQQVKLRGHRVELGEIEAVLRRHPAVTDAAVVVRGEAPGERLVAYAVLEGDEELSGLAPWLRERLPAVMVPSAWVALERLPLTPNGKIDRNRLPSPEPESGAGDSPGGTVELLAGIWSDVLGVADVGPDDDFFALGGNSLSTIQVAFRIRKTFGVEIPLRAFFRAPTVAGLAVRIEEALLERADADELERLLAELEGMSDEEAARLVGGERE